jgi:mono/diheme cytochrome c family protein
MRSLPTATTSTRFRPPAADGPSSALRDIGARTYREHCEDCHGADGLGKPYVYPALAGNRLVVAASANNALNMVLLGGFAPSTVSNPRPYSMPPYADRLSPVEVAGVLTYVRSSWGNNAPAVSPGLVRER